MDEQEFLHNLSIETNVNIELLKDLTKNEKFWTLIRSGKTIDAIMLLRDIQPRVGLREAKMVVEALIKEYK
jgi:ribosomal protein L7/L12